MAAGASAAAQNAWKPKTNPWLVAATVALAAFMEVLDTSIANVALPYIAGALGASGDESTWVLTSYLVSNAIVLPMGGWAIPAAVRYAEALAAVLLAAVGVQQAIRIPPLKNVEVAIANLPPSFDGYAILHLTDLHLSRLFPDRDFRRPHRWLDRDAARGCGAAAGFESARRRVGSGGQPREHLRP